MTKFLVLHATFGYNFVMHDNISFVTSDRQKLFSSEEKVLLNKRVPDLDAAASVSNPCSEQFISFQVISNMG